MTRRTRIIAGIVAALVLVTLAAGWAVNRNLYGIPAFMLWRPSTFEGAHRADVNAISLYYETYGRGRPVIVLHGAMSSLEVMHPFITDLGRDHRVIAIDSRAQGRSGDAAGPLTYAKMAADVIALMDTLGIEKADVIGWSDGGIIGLDMAMKHPTRVRRLVAIGANFTPDGVAPGTFSSEGIAELETSARALYDLIAPDPSHFDAMLKKVRKMIATEPNYTTGDLGRIRAMTLIVAGEHDIILRPHTDAMAKAIPGATETIVPAAGHDGPLTMPDTYSKLARDFLDR
jgi:pimeloyl-ACP methyl ester carboxylesterase